MIFEEKTNRCHKDTIGSKCIWSYRNENMKIDFFTTSNDLKVNLWLKYQYSVGKPVEEGCLTRSITSFRTNNLHFSRKPSKDPTPYHQCQKNQGLDEGGGGRTKGYKWHSPWGLEVFVWLWISLVVEKSDFDWLTTTGRNCFGVKSLTR